MTRKQIKAVFAATMWAASGHFLEFSGTGQCRIAIRKPHGTEWPMGRGFEEASAVLDRTAAVVA